MKKPLTLETSAVHWRRERDLNPFNMVAQRNMRERKGATRCWNFNANTLNALEMHACVKSAFPCVLPLNGHLYRKEGADERAV